MGSLEYFDQLYARILRAVSSGLTASALLKEFAGTSRCRISGQLSPSLEKAPESVRNDTNYLMFYSTLNSYNKTELRQNLISFMQEQIALLWPGIRLSLAEMFGRK